SKRRDMESMQPSNSN
ncbi:unnamed protein product, partial [Rotaria socialis]